VGPLVLDTDVASLRFKGELPASAIRRGRPRPVNDTWIATCCLAYELPLATFNVKDFSDFSEYDGLVLVTA
jgi:toxin FitB